jgi:hypothetical protein
MKPVIRMAFLFAIIVALAFPTVALANNPNAAPKDDKIILGNNFTLPSGETLDGSLIVFGGNATVEKGATVQGDIALFGGNLDLNGTVNRGVILVGGNASLGDYAVVQGDVNVIGAALHRSPSARINGQVIVASEPPLQLTLPPQIFRDGLLTSIRPFSRIFFDLGGLLAQSLGLAALAILLVLFMPKQLDRNARAVTGQPVATAGIGLLTLLVAPPLLILIAITIILIPATILGFILLGLAVLFGWISLGVEVGKRLGTAFNQTWHPVLAAGLGTFLLTLVVNSIGHIPCIGWVAPFLTVLFGLGAVVMTRFGTQSYPPESAATVTVSTPIPPTSGSEDSTPGGPSAAV